MPLYAVATRSPLAPAVAERVAGAVTTAHAELTGGPRVLVNVLFQHGYRLRAGERIDVSGTIRGGARRTDELTRRLEERLRADIAEAAGVPRGEVVVSLAKVPAKWAIEAGLVLPEPGTPEEEEWKAAVAALAD
ncbi:MAG: hypothetical protein ACRC20_13735 [Segniliparus sp.]|uniref:hypothetical protein n=1 Tax=Segniliparus sp. TaxID=2804064 RepID=UPI003F3FC004